MNVKSEPRVNEIRGRFFARRQTEISNGGEKPPSAWRGWACSTFTRDDPERLPVVGKVASERDRERSVEEREREKKKN